MTDLRALLAPIHLRLELADVASLDYGPSESDGYHIFPSDSDSAIAWASEQFVASLFANAPTDQAKLLAAIEAVVEACDAMDDTVAVACGDTGAKSYSAKRIRTALAAALGSDTTNQEGTQ